MKLVDILPQALVLPALTGRNKEEVLRELAVAMAAHHREIDAERLVQVLWDRERLGSTAIGDGIAIPHGKLPGIYTVVGAFGRHLNGVDFESLDNKPTRLLFLLVAPEDSVGQHLKALARVSRLLKEPAFRAQLLTARDQDELYRCIRDEDEKH